MTRTLRLVPAMRSVKVRADAIVINGTAVWLRARTAASVEARATAVAQHSTLGLPPQRLPTHTKLEGGNQGAIKARGRRTERLPTTSPRPARVTEELRSDSQVGPQLVPACSDQPMALSARASCAVGAAAKALGMKAPMQRAARRNRSRMWCLGLRFDAQ